MVQSESVRSIVRLERYLTPTAIGNQVPNSSDDGFATQFNQGEENSRRAPCGAIRAYSLERSQVVLVFAIVDNKNLLS